MVEELQAVRRESGERETDFRFVGQGVLPWKTHSLHPGQPGAYSSTPHAA